MRSLVVVLMLVSGAAFADRKVNTPAAISIDIARDWSFKLQGANAVFATAPADDAAVLFTNSDGATVKAVLDDVSGMIRQRATDLRWGARRPLTINSISAFAIDGTGKTGDRAVITRLVVVMSKPAVFLLSVVAADREPVYRSTLDRMTRSLQRAR